MSVVAFVGLGNMGFPMAQNLAAAGHQLLVQDQAADVVERFIAEQPTAKSSEHMPWDEAEVVITMLPTSDIVSAALFDGGIVDACVPGTMFIDMSSAEPAKSVRLGEQLDAKGMRYVDAPVSGGVRGAEAGKLAIMAGGSKADLDRAEALLQPLAKAVTRVGGSGTGHAAKALNNLVSAASVAVTVEALHIGETFGIDPATLTDVLNASSGKSNTSENKVKQFMLSGTFGSGFPIGLMSKDVTIALEMADELNVSAELSHAVERLWKTARDNGYAGDDHTKMYEILDSNNET